MGDRFKDLRFYPNHFSDGGIRNTPAVARVICVRRSHFKDAFRCRLVQEFFIIAIDPFLYSWTCQYTYFVLCGVYAEYSSLCAFGNRRPGLFELGCSQVDHTELMERKHFFISHVTRRFVARKPWVAFDTLTKPIVMIDDFLAKELLSGSSVLEEECSHRLSFNGGDYRSSVSAFLVHGPVG